MRIPQYRKHSSGQARVTLGGRTYYLGKHGIAASRREYNRLVGKWIAGRGVIISDGAKEDLSIDELFLAYVQWAKQNYRADGTELHKIKRIVRTTAGPYSRSDAAEFGFAQFEAVRASLVTDAVGESTSTS